MSSDRVIKLSLRAYVRIHNASDIESTIIVEILVMKLVHITFNFFYESWPHIIILSQEHLECSRRASFTATHSFQKAQLDLFKTDSFPFLHKMNQKVVVYAFYSPMSFWL